MKLGIRKINVGELKKYDIKPDEYIEYWGPLDRRKFKAIEGLEVTHDLQEADLIIIWNTIPPELLEIKNDEKIIKHPEKIIMLIQESPVAPHRRFLHENIDKFHTVVTHNPNGYNQINFTNPLAPQLYPWGPMLEIDLKRKYTKMTNKNFFYAARRVKGYEDVPNKYDTQVLYGARVKLVEAFKSKYPNRLKLYGLDWEDYAKEGISTKTLYSSQTGDWRKDKLKDVEASGSDFHIVLENCIQKNLITDHFHDGFNSDRVVFYLGCPNIEDYVPMDIFIDLRPYYNKETNEFDVDKIVEIADNMTQEEYDGYIQRARAWRKTLVDYEGNIKSHSEAHKLTDVLVERIKEYIKNEN